MSEVSAGERLAPVPDAERVELLDIVRGFALFGVLVANLLWTATSLGLTDAAREALPTVVVDRVAAALWTFFVYDKANTLFAFLFGLGFAIQLERGERRGGSFLPRFARRLSVLLLFGLLHNFLLWFGDILHLYALAGFLLIAARRLPNRGLVLAGLLFALLARPAYDFGKRAIPALERHVESIASPYSDEAIESRLERLRSGAYGDMLAVNWELTRDDWLLNGSMLAWIGYALGRFLLGYWVGRNRLLEQAARHRDGWVRLLRVALPAGLVLNGWRTVAMALEIELHGVAALLSDLLIQIGTLSLAATYLAGIVLLYLDSASCRAKLGCLAPVGRMALTNYLMQSVFYVFALYGVGLELIGRIGAAACWAIAIAFFALQILSSRWWLARFRFGPAEWLWRALTYGDAPPFRR